MSLRSEIKKAGPFDCLEQEAALNVHRTDDFLVNAMAAVFKPFNLSGPQYNVLRILRGAGGELPCLEIAGRMITCVPDVTRLVDEVARGGARPTPVMARAAAESDLYGRP